MKPHELERAIEDGRFDLDEVRKALDDLSVHDLQRMYGEPAIRAEWDLPTLHHWQPGQPRPLFANEDPAVQQAIGRCATARTWAALPRDRQPGSLRIAITASHRGECEFCDMPIAELLAACDWAAFEGRTQTAEWLTWTQERDGQTATYQRRLPVRRRNERHERFWALPSERRAELIQRAQSGGVPA